MAPGHRVDRPHLLLPSVHFEFSSDEKVEEFLTNADEFLNNERTSDEQIGTILRQIYGVLHEAMHCRTKDQWLSTIQLCRQHHLLETLHQDRFTRRAYEKPRGYPGDAVLLDYIYDQEMARPAEEMSEIGYRIHRWTTNSTACNGVKARRTFIAEMIDRVAKERANPEILSIACGHCREAEISSSILRNKIKRLVAVDTDQKSLDVVRELFENHGVETVQTGAREMITGRLDFGTFDFIYSAGLFDYLNDSICRRLVAKWFFHVESRRVSAVDQFCRRN